MRNVFFQGENDVSITVLDIVVWAEYSLMIIHSQWSGHGSPVSTPFSHAPCLSKLIQLLLHVPVFGFMDGLYFALVFYQLDNVPQPGGMGPVRRRSLSSRLCSSDGPASILGPRRPGVESWH